MATGTGYPQIGGDHPTAEPPQAISGDSSANSWARIAATGAQLAAEGHDQLRFDEHQRQVGYLAEQETEINRTRIDMRNKFAQDPAGFDAAWNGYRDGKLSEAATWAVPHIKTVLGRQGNEAYGSILGETRARDQHLDQQSMVALEQQSASDVVAAGMSGTIDKQEGIARLERYKGVLDSAVTARLMPKEKAEMLFDATVAKTYGEVAARQGVQIYQQEGFAPAVEHLRKSILENDALSLKPESRYQAFNRGVSAIRLQQTQDKQDQAGVVEVSRDIRARLDSNQPVDPGEINDALGALSKTGAAGEFHRLSVASAVSDATKPYRDGLNLRQFAGAVADQRTAAMPRGLRNNNPLNIETGQFTQAQPGFQGSDGRFAKFETMQQGMDAASELLARYGRQGIGTIAGVIGKWAPASDNNDVGAYSTFVAGKLGVGPNDAINLADPATRQRLASAMGEFENGKPVPGAEGMPGVPYAGEIAKRVQTVFVGQARKAWPEFKSLIDKGQLIDTEDFQSIRYAAQLSGDANWQQQVEAIGVANKIGQSAKDMPEAQRQSVLDQAKSQIQASGLPIIDQDTINKSLQAQFDRQNKMVREDPVAFAIERGTAAPITLNVGDSAAFQAGLAQRTSIVKGVAVGQEVPVGSVLRPAEIAGVQAALAASDPKGKARIFADLAAGIPDDRARLATFAKLGDKDTNAMVDAYAGALYRQAPDVSESIVRGQRAIAADARYDPLKDDKTTFNDKFDKVLPAATFATSARTNPLGALSTIKTAVRYRYADLSAQSGDTSADVNEDRLAKSIADVTGGVLRHNSGTLIAPVRGMPQAEFDKILWGVTDKDLVGASTLSGEPITAKYLQGSAQLESIADGRYLVRLGSDATKPLYAVTGIGNPFGAPAPFVLDLRGRPASGQKVGGEYFREFTGMPRG